MDERRGLKDDGEGVRDEGRGGRDDGVREGDEEEEVREH